MSKRRIGIDFDDVLLASTPEVIRLYNAAHGSRVTLANSFSAELSEWNALSLDEVVARLETIQNSDIFCDSALPLSGAPEAVADLSKEYELHIITSRSPFLREMTWYLTKKFYGDAISDIHMVGISGNETISKAAVCKELDVTLFVDDSPYHAMEVARIGKNAVVFGSYPWNIVNVEFANGVRIENWPQLAAYIRTI